MDGATTALSGDVIRSATWDNIHSDYAAAFTQLGQVQIQVPRIVVVAGNVTISTTDTIVIIQAAAPIITLPASSTRIYPVTIIGGAIGIFSANHSTITPNGTEKLNGLASLTMINDFQAVTFYPLPTGGYVIA